MSPFLPSSDSQKTHHPREQKPHTKWKNPKPKPNFHNHFSLITTTNKIFHSTTHFSLSLSPNAFWCPHKHPLAKTSQNAKNPKPKTSFHNHFSLITIRNKMSHMTTHFFTISLSLAPNALCWPSKHPLFFSSFFPDFSSKAVKPFKLPFAAKISQQPPTPPPPTQQIVPNT